MNSRRLRWGCVLKRMRILMVDWLDRVDPYRIQRLIFHKTLFVAVWMVFAYWLFKPGNLNGFIAPLFVVSVYDIPAKQRTRELRLLFMFGALLFCICSFYLLYPFKFVFLFYSLGFLAFLYFTILKYFPALRHASMLVIVNAALVLNTEPEANWQTCMTIFSSAVLSMTVMFCALKGYAWPYYHIWRSAIMKYMLCLEQEIAQVMVRYPEHPNEFSLEDAHLFSLEVQHLNIMRLYRPLIPRDQLRHSLKISHHVRNIQLALSNRVGEGKNIFLWRDIALNLHRLRYAMHRNRKCYVSSIHLQEDTALHHQAVRDLHSAVSHWNQLCS